MDERFASDTELARRFPNAPQARGERSDSLIEFVTDRAGHDWRYAIDASKIEQALGFVSQRNLSRRVWQKRSIGTSLTRFGGGRCWSGRPPRARSAPHTAGNPATEPPSDLLPRAVALHLRGIGQSTPTVGSSQASEISLSGW